MNKRLKLLLPFVLLFLGVWVVVLLSPISHCTLWEGFGFDAQNIFAWKYGAVNGAVPIRDFFYPYGLLSYYKDTNLVLTYIQSLFVPIHILLISLLFTRLTGSRAKGIASGVALFFFVLLFSDLESFQRYGSALSVLIAFVLWKTKSPIKSFVLGVLSSLLFTTITDQGVLAVLVLAVTSCIIYILEKRLSWRKHLPIKIGAHYVIGVGVGLLPLFLWFIHTSSATTFMKSMYYLSTLVTTGESSFLPFAFHPENLLVFLPLFGAIMLMSYATVFHNQHRLSSLEQMLFGVIVLTVFLEQKSLIRSISGSIVFLGPLLMMLSTQWFLDRKKYREASLVVGMFTIIAVSLLYMTFSRVVARVERFAQTLRHPNPRVCSMEVIQQALQKFPSSKALTSALPKDTRIYSFPADPILYPLFSSPLPPYFTTYEASPRFAQYEIIDWIKKRDIDTVIINTANIEMEGIQHAVRAPVLLEFLLKNYCPTRQVERYLLLNRCTTEPDFASFTNIAPVYAGSLLQAHLGEIPKKEWLMKKDKLAEITMNYPADTQDLFIFVQDSEPSTTLVLKTKNEAAVVTIEHCMEGCVIHVSNLPLFFFPQPLELIDAPSTTTIRFMRAKDITTMW